MEKNIVVMFLAISPNDQCMFSTQFSVKYIFIVFIYHYNNTYCVCPAGHVSVGNGGQMATVEEKKEDVIGTVEWSSATIEASEKRDTNDISGKHSKIKHSESHVVSASHQTSLMSAIHK